MNTLHACPGCGEAELSPPWVIRRQPVVLNYRFETADAARAVSKRDLKLVQCRCCGLIFNAAHDAAAIPYDENYENRQGHSAAFIAYLEELARDLTERHQLKNSHILEVGCGKGDFLKLLCRVADARGRGFDTSYEGPSTAMHGRVKFVREYLRDKGIHSPAKLLVCRHVVEHVGPIGQFLGQLAEIAKAAGNAVTVIETPVYEWIAKRRCFWDVFHEHCNYFPKQTLAYLCRLAGFRILRHRIVFGGQYQVLELQPTLSSRLPSPPVEIPELSVFDRNSEEQIKKLATRLLDNGAKPRRWAIWGAGAKGVVLVNRLRSFPPACLIDSNPAKQGCYAPGSAVQIVAPGDSRARTAEPILIANPNYEAEIRSALRTHGFSNRILTL